MRYLRQLAAVEHRLLDATTLLLAVIVKQAEGVFAKHHNGYQVAGRKEGHKEVDDVPYQLEAGHGTKHHHDATGEEAVDGQHRGIGRDEADIGCAVIVVADDAGEGKEENGYGDEHRTGGTDLRLQG